MKVCMVLCASITSRSVDKIHTDQLFESETRCAIIEAETREEVIREMEERMRSMERMYAKRLMDEVGDEISSTRPLADYFRLGQAERDKDRRENRHATAVGVTRG